MSFKTFVRNVLQWYLNLLKDLLIFPEAAACSGGTNYQALRCWHTPWCLLSACALVNKIRNFPGIGINSQVFSKADYLMNQVGLFGILKIEGNIFSIFGARQNFLVFFHHQFRMHVSISGLVILHVTSEASLFLKPFHQMILIFTNS